MPNLACDELASQADELAPHLTKSPQSYVVKKPLNWVGLHKAGTQGKRRLTLPRSQDYEATYDCHSSDLIPVCVVSINFDSDGRIQVYKQMEKSCPSVSWQSCPHELYSDLAVIGHAAIEQQTVSEIDSENPQPQMGFGSAYSTLNNPDLSARNFGTTELSSVSDSGSEKRMTFLPVFGHIGLLISTIKHWEHQFTFPVENQTVVSFWTTTITQGFGTVTPRYLYRYSGICDSEASNVASVISATHDNISSWMGLGSALATLYDQISVPASVFGTLITVAYLGCITILHITIPASLSVETFDSTVQVNASTFGIPEFANSTLIKCVNYHKGNHINHKPSSTRNFMATFPQDFLPRQQTFNNSEKHGLFNGSLYEVLQNTTPGKGSAQVSAVEEDVWDISLDGVGNASFHGMNPSLPSLLSPPQTRQYLPVVFTAETQGTPQWNESQHDAAIGFMSNNGGFLKWLGHLDQSQTLGLYNGSLYEVLTSPYREATAQVSAVDFNITCGYTQNHTIIASIPQLYFPVMPLQ
ncbi:hypothetical protein DFH09DRAFT_1067724 [Mycena vulgaris]|nr:hypothetical protein DFH09DRAFT_1067724 [Mycena vulgaris]